jgi:hypothetical protein
MFLNMKMQNKKPSLYNLENENEKIKWDKPFN